MRVGPIRSALLPLLLLAACSDSKSAGSEDRQLDEAAASLDANTADTTTAEIVDEDEGGNEDQPQ